jgi:hypothetical protein
VGIPNGWWGDWCRDSIRWRGRVLAGEYSHWCFEWDGLPVDETTREFTCCLCYTQTPEVLALQQHLLNLEAANQALGMEPWVEAPSV